MKVFQEQYSVDLILTYINYLHYDPFWLALDRENAGISSLIWFEAQLDIFEIDCSVVVFRRKIFGEKEKSRKDFEN